MLKTSPVAATLPCRAFAAAAEFYGSTLGLERIQGSVDMGFLAFRAGQGSVLQVFASESDQKSDNTAATFEVEDLDAEMKALRARGVVFEEYDLPDVKTVHGVADGKGMGRAAWFKDPDGNLLALHQGEAATRRAGVPR